MARPLRQDTDPEEFERVRHLVTVSEGDPLAPFALRPEKSFAFSPDGDAVVGYRVKLGMAVAGGDPVGNVEGWAGAIAAFVAFARERRLRVAVLGAGERARAMWEPTAWRSFAIGRDVVVRRSEFTTEGRRFRNLRQAIQRSRNAGVTVEMHREGDLRPEQVLELRGLMSRSQRDDRRGFAMILGRLFDGTGAGRRHRRRPRPHGQGGRRAPLPVGRQAGPVPRPAAALENAPNGVDERLIAEVVEWGALRGVERVSLAFAPFPDLFANHKAARAARQGRVRGRPPARPAHQRRAALPVSAQVPRLRPAALRDAALASGGAGGDRPAAAGVHRLSRTGVPSMLACQDVVSCGWLPDP